MHALYTCQRALGRHFRVGAAELCQCNTSNLIFHLPYVTFNMNGVHGKRRISRVSTNRMGMGMRFDHTHTIRTYSLIIDFVYGSYGLHTVAHTVAWTGYFRAKDAKHGHTPAGYPIPLRTRYALQGASF
jgi:hypothetical protein